MSREDLIKPELLAYAKFISAKASENSSDILANAGEDHAAIAMSNLFDKTQLSVKMVIGCFDGRVSNQEIYKESLKDCLKKENVKFQIIHLHDLNPESEALAILKEYIPTGQVRIYKSDQSFREKLSKDGSEKHFSIYDDRMCRFEKDSEKFLAWFSFNDLKRTEELKAIFDQGLVNATETTFN